LFEILFRKPGQISQTDIDYLNKHYLSYMVSHKSLLTLSDGSHINMWAAANYNAILEYICFTGKIDVVEYLMNVPFKNKCLIFNEDEAVRLFIKNRLEVLAFLLQKGFGERNFVFNCYNDFIKNGIWEEDLRFLTFLSDNGFNIDNKRYERGVTPLHLAVLHNKTQVINWLINRGVDVNIGNDIGYPPLYYARKADTMAVLMKYNARSWLSCIFDHSIKLINQKMEIIKRHKETNIPINLDELEILNKNISTSRLLPFIMEIKAQKFQAKINANNERIAFEPFVLYTKESMEAFGNYLYGMVASGDEFLYDCVFVGGGKEGSLHSQPVQVFFNRERVKIFTLDAAADITNFDAINNLASKVGATIFGFLGKRQFSSHGCPIFAVQDLNSLARMGEEEKEANFEFIVDEKDYNYLPLDEDMDDLYNFDKLNSRFIKNANSMKIFDKQKAALENIVSNKGTKLGEHIDRFSIIVESYDKHNNLILKKQNRALDFKTYKYLNEIDKEYGEALRKGESKCSEIIFKRTNFKDKNVISPEYIKTRFNAISLIHSALKAKYEGANFLSSCLSVYNEKSKLLCTSQVEKFVGNNNADMLLKSSNDFDINNFLTNLLNENKIEALAYFIRNFSKEHQKIAADTLIEHAKTDLKNSDYLQAQKKIEKIVVLEDLFKEKMEEIFDFSLTEKIDLNFLFNKMFAQEMELVQQVAKKIIKQNITGNKDDFCKKNKIIIDFFPGEDRRELLSYIINIEFNKKIDSQNIPPQNSILSKRTWNYTEAIKVDKAPRYSR
jgi:hypothetical protein